MITPIDSRGITGRTDRIALPRTKPPGGGVTSWGPAMLSQADISQPFFVQQETASAQDEKAAACQTGALSIWLCFPPSRGHQNFQWIKAAASLLPEGRRVGGRRDVDSLSPVLAELPRFSLFCFLPLLLGNTFPKAESSTYIIPCCRNIPGWQDHGDLWGLQSPPGIPSPDIHWVPRLPSSPGYPLWLLKPQK